MKRLCLILCSLLAMTLAGQTVNRELKIDRADYDFGTIAETAGVATHEFQLTNVGSQPITILQVKTGCRCVSAQAPTRPIAPGETIALPVRFDPANRSGEFRKELTIISQGKKINRLKIRGKVLPSPAKNTLAYRHDLGHGLMANYSAIDFGTIRRGRQKTVELRMMNDFPVGMKLAFEIEKPSDAFDVEIPRGFLLDPDAEACLPLTLRVKSAAKGVQSVNLIPIANGYRLSPLKLTVRCLP